MEDQIRHLNDMPELKWWNGELTLKCKLKCYVKPMKDPLGVSSSKGNQATTRGKEKILLTSLNFSRQETQIGLCFGRQLGLFSNDRPSVR